MIILKYNERDAKIWEEGYDDAKKALGNQVKSIFKKYHKEEVMRAVEEVLGMFKS